MEGIIVVKESFSEYFKARIRNKPFMAVIVAYIAFCFFVTVYWLIKRSARNAVMGLLYTAFSALVFIVEYYFQIRCGALFLGSTLFIAVGSILGSCFNVYTRLPWFDTLLHGASGVLFAALGCTFAERLFGNTSSFFGRVLFGVCFSLAIAALWEIFEYTCTRFLGFDMLEDTIVHRIESYLLSGNHNQTVVLENIYETVIYYGDGQSYTIGGYLDIGVIDTLTDMTVCTVGALIFGTVATANRKLCPKLNDALIPKPVLKNN